MKTAQIIASDFCVIGAGKLGLSIAEYIVRAGKKLSIVAASDDSYKKAKLLVDPNMIFRSVEQLFYVPKNFIITSRDNKIRENAEYIAKTFKYELHNRIVIHCSGIMTSDELESCKNYKAITASVHPYQTFYSPDYRLFEGIKWGIESSFGIDSFIPFVQFMGGISKEIDKVLKTMYHLSAVAVSNYLNSALALGKLASEKAGIDPMEFAIPIIRQTVENAIENSNNKEYALTGPIARADLETIKLHIKAGMKSPEILIPYCYMGLATLELAKNSGIANTEFISNARLLLLNAISETKQKSYEKK